MKNIDINAPEIDTSDWDFCPRMSLRALRLPCGEREECEGCEHLGDTKRTTFRSGVPDYGDRKCPVCGKVFVAEKRNQKYCSAPCRRAANDSQKKQVKGNA